MRTIASRPKTNEMPARCPRHTDGTSGDGKRATITTVDQLPLLISVPVMASTGAASEPQLRKMLREGELKGVKVGSDWRVSKRVFCSYFGLE